MSFLNRRAYILSIHAPHSTYVVLKFCFPFIWDRLSRVRFVELSCMSVNGKYRFLRPKSCSRILVCQAICEKRCCCVLLRQLQLVLESSLPELTEFDEELSSSSRHNIQSHASLPFLALELFTAVIRLKILIPIHLLCYSSPERIREPFL